MKQWLTSHFLQVSLCNYSGSHLYIFLDTFTGVNTFIKFSIGILREKSLGMNHQLVLGLYPEEATSYPQRFIPPCRENIDSCSTENSGTKQSYYRKDMHIVVVVSKTVVVTGDARVKTGTVLQIVARYGILATTNSWRKARSCSWANRKGNGKCHPNKLYACKDVRFHIIRMRSRESHAHFFL